MEKAKEWLSQVFLGQSRLQLNSCLGIYFGQDSATIVVAQKKGGRPVLKQRLKVPFPALPGRREDAAPSAALKTSFVSDPAPLAAALEKAMEKISWSGKQVVVALSSQFSILRYFSMPMVEKRFWHRAIPLEAKKYIPVPLEEVAYDFHVTVWRMPDGKQRLGILFGVVYKKVLEGVKEIVEKMGLVLAGVEPASSSAGRFLGGLGSLSSEGVIRVHFDPAIAYILVSHQGIPVLSREVVLGEDIHGGERKRLDLAGGLDFVKKQIGGASFKSVRITGVDVEMWKAHVASESGLPVEVEDITSVLGVKEGEWGALAGAGAAWKYLIPPAGDLDLTASGRVSEEEKTAVFTIWACGMALAGFFFLLGLVNWGLIYFKKQELTHLLRKTKAIEAFQGQKPEQIQTMVQEMRDQVNILEGFLSEEGLVYKKMQQLADNIPEGVWVKNFKYSFPMDTAITGRANKSLNIAGEVSSSDATQEVSLVNEFKKALDRDKDFHKDLPQCDSPSIQTQSNVGQVSKGGGRTSFNLVCRQGA
ncbi:MAG: pilus assembly protein PilM [Elusimicrobia bacterium]|nr:pilus assembly protein PilM [Elusimicrobiota bacterium]